MTEDYKAIGNMSERGPRLAIVLSDGQWFIRRVASLVHDDLNGGAMVYHCDKCLGGPIAAWSDVAKAVDAYLTGYAVDGAARAERTPQERAQAVCNGMFTGHANLYKDEITKTIADAVAAEREACAEIAEDSRTGSTAAIATAIRARNNLT